MSIIKAIWSLQQCSQDPGWLSRWPLLNRLSITPGLCKVAGRTIRALCKYNLVKCDDIVASADSKTVEFIWRRDFTAKLLVSEKGPKKWKCSFAGGSTTGTEYCTRRLRLGRAKAKLEVRRNGFQHG